MRDLITDENEEQSFMFQSNKYTHTTRNTSEINYGCYSNPCKNSR